MPNRELLLAILVVLPVLALVNLLWAGWRLRTFLTGHRGLDSFQDLDEMKATVAHQMYAALVQIPLLGAPPLILLVGIVRGILGPADVVWVILPALVVLVVSLQMRGLERSLRRLPASDPELERQRDAVVETWLKRPLPDW